LDSSIKKGSSKKSSCAQRGFSGSKGHGPGENHGTLFRRGFLLKSALPRKCRRGLEAARGGLFKLCEIAYSARALRHYWGGEPQGKSASLFYRKGKLHLRKLISAPKGMKEDVL